MTPGRRSLTVALMMLMAGCLFVSLQLSGSSAWIARIVASGTLALLALQLLVESLPMNWPTWLLDTRKSLAAKGAQPNGAMLPALAWITALPLAIWLLGTAPGAGLYCLAWLRWHSNEGWAYSAVFAFAIAASVQLLFGTLLDANLHTGLVLGWFS